MKQDLNIEQVTPIYEKISASEQNFNALQLEYRKLASGWLLAVFGGIGFLLSTNYEDQNAISIYFLIYLVGVGGFIGICLIWLLDLIVYHRLLRSYFLTGLQLEYLYPQFLPPTRSIMRQLERDHNKLLSNVIWFYLISCGVCSVISLIALVFYQQQFCNGNNIYWLGGLTAILESISIYFLRASTLKKETINKEISNCVFTDDEIISNMHSRRKTDAKQEIK